MYYRRKIILALLQIFEGELEKIRLQKILFLFSQKQQKGEYDFIPYKFGCFSYSANADLTTMVNKGLLNETETSFKRLDKTNYVQTLKENDRKLLLEIKRLYGTMSANALMKHTYINYPFYAVNSIKAHSILTAKELLNIEKVRPKEDSITLYTIGYEGVSLEEYLNRLIKNNVKVLVDVRRNPLSMKYGFSKSSLSRFCENLGISYVHFPEVGIQSSQRQDLKNQSDYDKLFISYCENELSNTIATQNTILSLLKQHRRIALTCFEKNICQCHRTHLAKAITSLSGFDYQLKHL